MRLNSQSTNFSTENYLEQTHPNLCWDASKSYSRIANFVPASAQKTFGNRVEQLFGLDPMYCRLIGKAFCDPKSVRLRLGKFSDKGALRDGSLAWTHPQSDVQLHFLEGYVYAGALIPDVENPRHHDRWYYEGACGAHRLANPMFRARCKHSEESFFWDYTLSNRVSLDSYFERMAQLDYRHEQRLRVSMSHKIAVIPARINHMEQSKYALVVGDGNSRLNSFYVASKRLNLFDGYPLFDKTPNNKKQGSWASKYQEVSRRILELEERKQWGEEYMVLREYAAKAILPARVFVGYSTSCDEENSQELASEVDSLWFDYRLFQHDV